MVICIPALISLVMLGGIIIGGIAIFACECRCNHPSRELPPLK